MKLNQFLVILLMSLLLGACGRNKEPFYYVLNPIFLQTKQGNQYNNLRIGIDEVNVPDYLDKPQLSLYCTANQSRIHENHLWAEEVESNIKRVIKTNLSTLLPGALIEQMPWDSKFNPQYRLQVDIGQFKVNIQGWSTLQAEYVIYNDNKPIKKYTVYYRQKIPLVNPHTLVVSMNENLTRLTKDIAGKLISP